MLLVRDERLVEFSFSSQFEADVQPETVLRVARQSWSENRRAGVTGRLRVEAGRVEQTIEGPSTVILALASRILTDRRHREIVIRRFGPICARSYADWSVAGIEALAPTALRPAEPCAPLRLIVSAPTPASAPETPQLAVARAT